MVLCSVCRSIDLYSLLLLPLEEHPEIRSLHKAEVYQHSKEDEPYIKLHYDIFKVRNSADGGCELCRVIFSAFEGREVVDEEIVKGLPIILSKQNDEIIVGFDSSEGLIKLCGFDVYVKQDSLHIQESAPLIFLREMNKDSGSQSSLTLAAGWLTDCVDNHADCSTSMLGCQKLPSRVLNVGDETRNPFLVEPAADGGLEKWVALSYCWGGEPSMKLTEDTMGTLKQGVSLNRFDPTIRDAILVTRALRITYLWIDALCILQDYDSKDWHEQSSKMNEIYGGSTVTIVAVDSSSVMQGFLEERELHYIALEWLPYKKSPNESHRCADAQQIYLSPSWNSRKDGIVGPWTTRGWTMQEGLLPDRLLFYTSHQMIWKCCTGLKYERGVTFEPSEEVVRGITEDGDGTIWSFDTFTKFKLLPWYLQLLPEQSIAEKYRLWYELVKDYSPRHFRYVRDRLIAISGLAKIFGDLIGNDEYVAGLWKGDMVRGLLWHVSGVNLIPAKSAEDSTDGNMAPSWSWTSAGVNVVINDHIDQSSFRALSTVEGVEVDLVDPSNPFGAVNGGSVTITGPLARLSRLYNKEWRCKETLMPALERHISKVVEEESIRGVEEVYSFPSDGRYAALQVLQHFPSMDRRLDLLILEATGGNSKCIPIYRRVGVLTLRHFDQRLVASPSLRDAYERSKHSLRSRLGPESSRRRVRWTQCKEVFLELAAEPWLRQTVIIV
ncbi:hypothetical protein GP486_000744 [Trichoglossum hirsutum]|uniref:Heterokaryon incompatibility domain-containing protein n=1 Tax=Trichoglossum hirsutum TaxID=265104 RepID=A0A9P8LI04_9PEZI|nr:hypothetical protein GP486_000744 [Trichoglossum hirsutum]